MQAASQINTDHLRLTPPLEGIKMTYDVGCDNHGAPVVYAVLDERSLSHLPPYVLRSVGVSMLREDMHGDTAFFVGRPGQLHLYVDTDAFPSFAADVKDVADEMGRVFWRDGTPLIDSLDQDGEVRPNLVARYISSGMERVETAAAIGAVERLREIIANWQPVSSPARERGADNVGSGLEF